jgi:histone arginine demethylase JMJD6
VILTDALKDWPAQRTWRLDALEPRFGEHGFKTDEVIDGKKIYMPFSSYLRYFAGNVDDDPIYLFDPDFADHAPSLLDDYRALPFFQEDLFAVLGEEKRPLYRWWVVGPRRSGSCFHLDPYMTSAWNALLVGMAHPTRCCERW